MISEKIAALVLQNVNFTDDTLEGFVENVVTKTQALTRAGIDFDNLNDTGDDTVGDGIVELANQFGTVFPSLTGEQKEAVKAAFGKAFTASTPEKESAGEALFNASVELLVAIQELNAYVEGQIDSGE